jgi:hypothetical protein
MAGQAIWRAWLISFPKKRAGPGKPPRPFVTKRSRAIHQLSSRKRYDSLEIRQGEVDL